MDYIDWAKKNRKALAERILKNSGGVPEEHPVAIIMAGIPGAGKTEFLNRLLTGAPSPIIHIDLDAIVTEIKGYKPEKYYAFRNAANPILEKLLDKVLDRKVSFALDGTFGHSSGLKNIQRALDHGFYVFFIYIDQDPRTAWEITKARELVTKRGVERDGFIETCLNVPARVHAAINAFSNKENFYTTGVVKDDLNNYTIKKIDDMLSLKYNGEELNEKVGK